MANTADPIVQGVVTSPFGRELELRVEEARPDLVRIVMPFSKRRTTVGETVHGGAIAALLDTAATAAAWSGVEDPAQHRGTTIGFNVNFLDGTNGEDLMAEARVIRRGGSITVLGVSVLAAGERLVAEGLVTYKLSRVRSS